MPEKIKSNKYSSGVEYKTLRELLRKFYAFTALNPKP